MSFGDAGAVAEGLGCNGGRHVLDQLPQRAVPASADVHARFAEHPHGGAGVERLPGCVAWEEPGAVGVRCGVDVASAIEVLVQESCDRRG